MRFLLRFQLALLLVGAGGLALLFGLTGYAELVRQVLHPAYSPFFLVSMPPNVALTPARYQVLCRALAATALLAAGLLLVTRPPSRGARTQASARPGGLARLPGALVRAWHRLRPAERWLGGGLLLTVVGCRLYYAVAYPLSLDEIASYDYYALPGAAATASYYPYPNNHILPNLLVGLVHHVLPGAAPGLALRLVPTLLGLVALPVSYLLALRYLRGWVATLGLGLYWLSPLAGYYAVAGRGYAWGQVATLAGLLAALELLRPGARRGVRQLAWGVFGGSGVLGLYAVPTHAYVVAGLGLGLLVGLGRPAGRRWRVRLASLAVASAGMGLVAFVLYGPVGAVSGWPMLLANRYVAHQAGPAFWAGVGPFLVGTAAELLGQRGISTWAYLGMLALAPVALSRGRLPAPARRLGWLLWLQLGLWLPLSLLQHVNPPARTLLPALLAFFVLLPLCGQALGARWRPATPLAAATGSSPTVLLGVAVLLGLYGRYRLHREQVVMAHYTRQQHELRQAYAWLRRQPLRRIWVEPRAYALFWQHYAVSAGQPPLPLQGVYDVPGARPGPVGEVEALAPGPLAPGPERPARYRSALVLVVPVSPTQPLLAD